MNHQPSPTGLPGQSGITRHIPVPLPTPSVELYADGRGFLWRLAEDGPAGARRFVPAAMDPTEIPRLAWAHEDELIETCGALTPLERAA